VRYHAGPLDHPSLSTTRTHGRSERSTAPRPLSPPTSIPTADPTPIGRRCTAAITAIPRGYRHRRRRHRGPPSAPSRHNCARSEASCRIGVPKFLSPAHATLIVSFAVAGKRSSPSARGGAASRTSRDCCYSGADSARPAPLLYKTSPVRPPPLAGEDRHHRVFVLI